jgi:hypothetical protein
MKLVYISNLAYYSIKDGIISGIAVNSNLRKSYCHQILLIDSTYLDSKNVRWQ